MSQKRGAYAPEFRQQMVELVKAGRKVRELAQEFGYHETSITAWVRQAQADQIGGTKARCAVDHHRAARTELTASPITPSPNGAGHPGKGYGLVCQQRQRQDSTR